MKLISKLLIFFIKGYQVIIKPLFPTSCRFHPSCSEYTVQSIQKYGPLRGIWLGVNRIRKCHPYNPGGYDPVP